MEEGRPELNDGQTDELTALMGEPLRAWEYLTSGAANHIFRLKSDSRTWVAKVCKEDIPDLFRFEAEALERMDGTGTVTVPRVLGVSEGILLMEDLGPEAEVADDGDWFDFGRDFGALHSRKMDYYGYPFDNYLGIWTQKNTPEKDWVDFYYKNRVSCYYDAGRNGEFVTADDIAGIEGIFLKMKDLVPDLPPALCHGDFWMNNVFKKVGGGIVLIDPALHYGHPEADLANTQLYKVFPEAFYEGYDESYGLIPGWRERLPLYQLKELLLMIAQFGHEKSLVRLREIIARFR